MLSDFRQRSEYTFRRVKEEIEQMDFYQTPSIKCNSILNTHAVHLDVMSM